MRISILFLLLAGCSAPSHWQLSTIPSADHQFDSARLVYPAEDRLSGVALELVRSGEGVSAYLFSSARRFKEQEVAHLFLGEELLEAPLILHEGRMRARLPDEAAKRCLAALEEGLTIGVNVGPLEQKFLAEEFSSLYEQLTREQNPFSGILKGPL